MAEDVEGSESLASGGNRGEQVQVDTEETFETAVLPLRAVLVKVAQHRGGMDIKRSENLVPGGDCSGKIDKRAAALLMTVDPMSWKPLRTGAVEITGRIQTLLTSSHRGFPVPAILILLEFCVELHRQNKRVM